LARDFESTMGDLRFFHPDLSPADFQKMLKRLGLDQNKMEKGGSVADLANESDAGLEEMLADLRREIDEDFLGLDEAFFTRLKAVKDEMARRKSLGKRTTFEIPLDPNKTFEIPLDPDTTFEIPLDPNTTFEIPKNKK